MDAYLNGIDAATGQTRTIAPLATVLGADSVALAPLPPMPAAMHQSTLSEFLAKIRSTAPEGMQDSVGTLAGAAAGAYLWKKHRWLGGIGGASLGRNAQDLLHPAQRTAAMCNLGVTGAGVAGSMLFKKHPVIGFVLGFLGGGLALSKVQR